LKVLEIPELESPRKSAEVLENPSPPAVPTLVILIKITD
jgi:hypothetical protein